MNIFIFGASGLDVYHTPKIQLIFSCILTSNLKCLISELAGRCLPVVTLKNQNKFIH